jgi:hypothetical protein
MMRPIYFMVPFWGERYRNYFLRYCLASLMAEGNFPILRAQDGHTLLIATTREDFAALLKEPPIKAASKHVTITFVPIETPTEDGYGAAIWRQSDCQWRLGQRAFEDRAYGCMLLPDLIFSRGFVDALLKRIDVGCKHLRCSALRQSMEGIAEVLPHDIALQPREVAALNIRFLHREMFPFLMESKQVHPHPPYLIWKLRSGGLVFHCWWVLPVLLDYAAIDEHHMPKDKIFEQYYELINFPDAPWEAIEDSDEMAIISLTPDEQIVEPGRLVPGGGTLRQIWCAAGAYYWACKHPRQREYLMRSHVWHSSDLTGADRRKIKRVKRIIHIAARLSPLILLAHYLGVLWRALKGEPAARETLRRKIAGLLPV